MAPYDVFFLSCAWWREFDVCIPYAAIAANKRHIQKRHAKFIVARGSRDSDIWSGTCSNGSQMSESNREGQGACAAFLIVWRVPMSDV
jgi:hypothetical protein